MQTKQQVALVTGASRGVGRGAAAALALAGMRVYATGRTIIQESFGQESFGQESFGQESFGPEVIAIPCDHTDDSQVAQLFERIKTESGGLDVLVNSAWGGYERMVENGRFTWAAPFWEQPRWRWDAMITSGVRAAFVASQYAAQLMVPAGKGLIVHISSWAAQKRIGNTIYGVAKCATDKLANDMAEELR